MGNRRYNSGMDNACVSGGPCAAHEVEQFVWSDHFVVPVVSTGGAAGGQFGVPLKILEVRAVRNSFCKE